MAELLITVEDAKKYARIDNDIDDSIVENLINFAEQYITDALGDNFPREDARIKTVAKCIVNDMYDKREFIFSNSGNKVSNSVNWLCRSALQQIRLEMRSG